MELMLLVWLVDFISNLDTVIFALVCTWIGLSCFIGFLYLMNAGTSYYEESCLSLKKFFNKYLNHKKPFVSLVFVTLLIPSAQTMKYMAGAYLLQATFESEFVQEATTLSQKAVIQQLKVWSEDTEDLRPLLENIGVELPKDLPESKNK